MWNLVKARLSRWSMVLTCFADLEQLLIDIGALKESDVRLKKHSDEDDDDDNSHRRPKKENRDEEDYDDDWD